MTRRASAVARTVHAAAARPAKPRCAQTRPMILATASKCSCGITSPISDRAVQRPGQRRVLHDRDPMLPAPSDGCATRSVPRPWPPRREPTSSPRSIAQRDREMRRVGHDHRRLGHLMHHPPLEPACAAARGGAPAPADRLRTRASLRAFPARSCACGGDVPNAGTACRRRRSPPRPGWRPPADHGQQRCSSMGGISPRSVGHEADRAVVNRPRHDVTAPPRPPPSSPGSWRTRTGRERRRSA